MRSVKAEKGSTRGTTADRLTTLLEVFSPWGGISLTYRQFAAELGPPVTEGAVKKWPQRTKFPSDAARLIVTKARERGLTGVTLEWLLWGDGARPQKAPKTTPIGSAGQHHLTVGREADAGPAIPTRQKPHGRFAAALAQALEADLGHNEFGQWSSDEVRHTVIWALKDLARRLWVLRFNMGETFELTDQWAGKIGLPVRPPEAPSEEPQ